MKGAEIAFGCPEWALAYLAKEGAAVYLAKSDARQGAIVTRVVLREDGRLPYFEYEARLTGKAGTAFLADYGATWKCAGESWEEARAWRKSFLEEGRPE